MLKNWCFNLSSSPAEERLDILWVAHDGSENRTSVWVEYEANGAHFGHITGRRLEEDVIDEVRSDLNRFDSDGWQKPLHYEVFV